MPSNRVAKSSLRSPVTPTDKLLAAILQEQEETNKLLRKMVKMDEEYVESTVVSDQVEQPPSRSHK